MGNSFPKNKEKNLSSKESEEIRKQIRNFLLKNAIKQDDVLQLRQLLRYFNPNLVLPNGRTPLTLAIDEQKHHSVSTLLVAGADSELQDGNGRHPVIEAVRSRNEAVLNIVLSLVPQVNVYESSGTSPIHAAAEIGNLAALKRLINFGADVNTTTKNESKTTPLIIAATFGHDRIVEELIHRGADVNHKDLWGYSPIIKAASNGHISTVKLLLRNNANVNDCNRSGASALQYSLMHDRCQTAQYLIEQNSKLEIFNRQCPLLLAATLNGCIECLKLLLNKSLTFHQTDQYNRPMLYYALTDFPNISHYYKSFSLCKCKGRLKIAEFLLNEGADIRQVFKLKFWNTRYKSSEQFALYRLALRALNGPVNFDLSQMFLKFYNIGCLDSLLLLVSIGYTPDFCLILSPTSKDKNLKHLEMERNSQPNNMTFNEFRGIIGKRLSHPLKLKYLCRNHVRGLLSYNVIFAVSQLNISSNLKNSLLLNSSEFYDN
ncbi:unnamed protein product [Dimorphilus gyrociliatus]|uniref:Uncharacterized protein n=1 Tax=Dimorphilus gyrociliatus TaxID=2664684 RepID=A0A7I8VFB6_9ANNE|nr:unnamed protein product [Dimorphilus gyrociliatus]